MIIALCFFPIAIIFIIIKFSLLTSSSVAEVKYVREESAKPHGPYLDDVYGDVDKKEEAARDF